MSESTSHQVLTEVALALAMVFFALMVLGLMAVRAEPSLTHAEPVQLKEARDPGTRAPPDGTWLVHYQDQFYDTNLTPTMPPTGGEQRLLLLVAPDLTVQALHQLQGQLSGSDLSIALMDQHWLARLEELP
ncbi:MAG: hypothetical protein SV765_09000 [Pseudomonadota bacterium]|nr:hypothetical protein [Pseudomonadota bacterium]